jgi:hypothetical protein
MQEAQQEGGLSYQPVNIIDPRMSKAWTAVALHLNRGLP